MEKRASQLSWKAEGKRNPWMMFNFSWNVPLWSLMKSAVLLRRVSEPSGAWAGPRETKGGTRIESPGICLSRCTLSTCWFFFKKNNKHKMALAATAEDFPSTVKMKVLEMRSRTVDLFGYISQGQSVAGWMWSRCRWVLRKRCSETEVQIFPWSCVQFVACTPYVRSNLPLCDVN